MKNSTIKIQFNVFGPFLQEKNIKNLLNSEKDIIAKQLEYFFDRPFSTINQDALKRYGEITTKENHINITPAHEKIFDRIIKPIILAKRHYCLGEYLSCIAMSGLVGEMLAILVWKISGISINSTKIPEETEILLLGRTFEKLGQERCINVLKGIQAIKNEDVIKFNELKTLRNKHLHSWEYDSRQQKGDARKMFNSSMILFKQITGMGIKIDENRRQSIKINPILHSYLNSFNR